jgi:carboxylesterase type B
MVTASGVLMLIGATGEEFTRLQGFADPLIFALTTTELPRCVAAGCEIDPAAAGALIATCRASRPLATPARLYAAIASDRRFGFGSVVQGERQAAQAPVFACRLLWQTQMQGGWLSAPHNLDPRLVFGGDRAPGITGEGTAHHALAAMQAAWQFRANR